MNINQWYSLKYILERIDQDKRKLLLGAKVKIDPKDRTLFKRFRRYRDSVVANEGQGILFADTRCDKKAHQYKIHGVKLSVDGSFVPMPWLNAGRMFAGDAELLTHWKIYIDEDLFTRLFIAVFRGEDNA
jgi:hypothetical protein